jgi:elongation factor G
VKVLLPFPAETHLHVFEQPADGACVLIDGACKLSLEMLGFMFVMLLRVQVEAEVGKPRVNYREAITQRADFDYLHKKQSGLDQAFPRVQAHLRTHMHIE